VAQRRQGRAEGDRGGIVQPQTLMPRPVAALQAVRYDGVFAFLSVGL
jgi:hypothetical protein